MAQTAVVAVGGNSLIRAGEQGTIAEQLANTRRTADAIVGELDGGRTARSLAYLLSKFPRVKIHFVSPAEVGMRPDILAHLDEHDVWYNVLHDDTPIAGEVDVIYQARIRPERVADGAASMMTRGRCTSSRRPTASSSGWRC